MRTYIATCDNGHDYFSLEYKSEHKNNSKANMQDAINQLRKCGKYVYQHSWIISTHLYY